MPALGDMAKRLRGSAIGVMALSALFVTTVSQPAAQADTRSDYAAARGELARLENQSDVLVDEYNAASERLDDLKQQVSREQAKVDDLGNRLAEAKKNLQRQAASLYVYGSASPAGGLTAIADLESTNDVG